LISCTKTVAARRWIRSGTFSGVRTQEMMSDVNLAMSRLSAEAVHATIAVLAASTT